MTDDYRDAVIAAFVAKFPKTFWQNADKLYRQMYLEAFWHVQNNPGVAREHKPGLLHQERFFRADTLLQRLAEDAGLASSLTAIATNTSYYCYVASGDIGLTQAYVPAIGALPKPTDYRNALAVSNPVWRLDLGDEPPEMLRAKPLYGLLAHNPVGKEFTEKRQSLGTMQICVPTPDFNSWEAEILLPEIVASYPSVSGKEGAIPAWKKSEKDKGKA